MSTSDANIAVGAKRSSDAGEEDKPEDGDIKKAKLEEDLQVQDPGKKNYHEMKLILKQLGALVARPDKSEEMLERIRKLMYKLVSLVTTKTAHHETPNPIKLLQMHLKYVLFNSEAIKDEYNIKTFLNGLEDGSAVKSDGNDSIHVFLANYATELWYKWDEELQQWKWTPEADWSFWMPCATVVVTDGEWKGEVPAPENVEIIKYLNTLRPIPSDEQYLPTSFNVVQILQGVFGLGEEELVKGVKSVVTSLLDCAVGSKDVELVVKTLKQLEEISAAGGAGGGGGAGVEPETQAKKEE